MSTLHRVTPEFAAASRLRADDYSRLYKESVEHNEAFWRHIGQRLD